MKFFDARRPCEAGPKNAGVTTARLFWLTVCCLSNGATAWCQTSTALPRGVPNTATVSNAVTQPSRWHTIQVTPRPGQPAIRTRDKFNPVWWFENCDEPAPPDWYRPANPHRVFLWRCRNPFHNFDNYVIGIADQPFRRSGRWPERNSSPRGGWDFEVARRMLALLPFFAYQRGQFNFYFGWRERGNFGIKLNWSAPAASQPANPVPEAAAKPLPDHQ